MYNTPKECHIAIDQRLQQLNSNRKLVLSPEEKDMRLNEAVIQFVRNVCNKKSNSKLEGYEDTQKRYDDIQELMRTKTLPVYINDSDTVISPTPWDYFELVNDRSILKYDCNGVSYGTAVADNTTAVVLRFPTDTVSTSTYYAAFTISLTILGVPTIIYSSVAQGLPAFKSGDSKFTIINNVLEILNTAGTFEVYWEYYLDHYEKNSFIIIPSIAVTGGSLTYTNIPGGTVTVATTTYLYNTYPTITWGTTIKKSNELVSHEDVYDMLNNYYYAKNRHLKPLSNIQRGFIKVFHDSTFIIKEVEIDYIKIPRLINYRLNLMCELSNMEEIIAIAVETILADKANDYKTFATERTIKE